MADRNLGAHHIQQVIQISAMHDVRQHCSVHFLVFRPIGAMQVWHIEIITLVPPAFIEYLFEFLLGIQMHAQVHIDAALARLWWRSIRINDEERWRWRRATRARRPTSATAAAASGAIDKLMTVRADFVSQDAGRKRSRPPIAKPV